MVKIGQKKTQRETVVYNLLNLAYGEGNLYSEAMARESDRKHFAVFSA